MNRLKVVKIQLTNNVNFNAFQTFAAPYLKSGQFEWERSGNQSGRWILFISKVPKELFIWDQDFIFVPTVQGYYAPIRLWSDVIPITKDNYHNIDWRTMTNIPPEINEEL